MVRNKIIQPWDNNGRLVLIVYGSDSQNNISTTFASSNVGQGSGALAWLIGDVRGNSKADIIQPWDNNGRLGLIVYGFDVHRTQFPQGLLHLTWAKAQVLLHGS